jgi:Ni,Fe-hydrogenase III large subunit
MTSLREAIDKGERRAALGSWSSRVAVDHAAWVRIAREISKGHGDMLGLWSDGVDIHMAVRVRGEPVLSVVSLASHGGGFHAIGGLHAPAQRLERTIADVYGLAPTGLDDARPWLDHGVWDLVHPAGDAAPRASQPEPYRFLAAEGAPLHQIPVGPVHAGIIEPGHFRFTANGETIVRLEERLGYVHKGVETLMRGAAVERGAKLAARVSGDSTVACSFAFARAVEMALGLEIPVRAKMVRAIMAELERIANHVGDIGAICNDAAYSMMLAHCAVLREQVLRTAQYCFGHRLMMDCVAPGGIACDLAPDGVKRIRETLEAIDATFPKLCELYDGSTSLQDRTVATGKVGADLVNRFATGGVIGRASGRAFDARRVFPYAPYDEIAFESPVREEGDVDARVRVRMDEVVQSIAILRHLLPRLVEEPVRVDLPAIGRESEGLALVEGFRGDILVWVRLDASGAIASCHLRDPSWFQWPLLEAAIEGNIVADFPLCNKSFNCSYSGHDL